MDLMNCKRASAARLTHFQTMVRIQMAGSPELHRREHAEAAREQQIAKTMALTVNSDLGATRKSKRVKLDVGGKTFSVSLETLQKVPGSYLCDLVAGDYEKRLESDGTMFIDRDPEVFPLILIYLRHHGTSNLFDLEEWSYGLTWRELWGVQIEAKFYRLPDLRHLTGILGRDEWIKIEKVSPYIKKRLLYCTSRDKTTSSTERYSSHFWSRCAGKVNTLCVFRIEGGNVVGAFTTLPWTYTTDPIPQDGKAFLFSKVVTGEISIVHGASDVPLCLNHASTDAIGWGNEDLWIHLNEFFITGESIGELNFDQRKWHIADCEVWQLLCE